MVESHMSVERLPGTRRQFITCTAAAATAALLPAHGSTTSSPTAREADFYTRLPDSWVQCGLCAMGCLLEDGERGHCRARENRKGVLYSLVYGHPVTTHVDPIEKKPFFHVYPGSHAFSLATVGCNFRCRFCQNWDISQATPESRPRDLVKPDMLATAAAASRAKTVAYTYNEPTVFYEYMRDCAIAARAKGLGNVVVSNGFIQGPPLAKLLPQLTAYKVDLKAFTDSFYRDVCEARLQPVLDTLKRLSESGVWFEIVVLTIPTLNDKQADIQRMAAWIVKELGQDVPLHFTRFHPCYRMVNLPRTPVATLERARATAMKEGLHFVYTGNMPGHEGETTFCPGCKKPVIKRYGFTVVEKLLKDGKCADCDRAIPGVWA